MKLPGELDFFFFIHPWKKMRKELNARSPG
jgi:hypothetical protein